MRGMISDSDEAASITAALLDVIAGGGSIGSQFGTFDDGQLTQSSAWAKQLST